MFVIGDFIDVSAFNEDRQRSAGFYNLHEDEALDAAFNFHTTPHPPSSDLPPLDDEWWTTIPQNNDSSKATPTQHIAKANPSDWPSTPHPVSFDFLPPLDDEWWTTIPQNNDVPNPSTDLPKLPSTPAQQTSAWAKNNPPALPRTPSKPTAPVLWPVSPRLRLPSNATPTRPTATANLPTHHPPTSPSPHLDRETDKKHRFRVHTPAMMEAVCGRKKDRSGRIQKSDGGRKGKSSGKGKIEGRNKKKDL
ncbi:uncharacterized protein MYCGRDRAFT_97948 [Zymoseptoria tritici IPO323]|uniref:Uncharacterized protein n=1 Tax=Zymoseptoria tritici (strain CBS 115943 / IPO323) TaxID=336722 RepID=F9XRV6_ZYMTI|nr:uncharacterized protein MYCGRDRAFT_97948 [Zymoseptoria tritici IPO323]EGP81981.1 hypothetical protein MYCGRDRAFT_97948 [Zymoseptoria tritici IPO323]